jgi:ferritin-like metal-binding protein YciE
LAEIEDLYDCEKRLTKALPKMAKASTTPELKKAFESHLQETQGHVERLERVFSEIGKKPKAVPCEAIKGLIEEGEEMIGNTEASRG